MTAAAILARAVAAGVTVTAAGDRLRLVAPTSPDPALLHALAGVKDELLDLLAERHAIQAEPPLPALGTPERERMDVAQREMLAGLMAAATTQPTDKKTGKNHG